MIRIATVGTSVITESFIGAVSRTPGIEVAAVTSRDIDRARAYADRMGVAGAFGDLASMLADPAVDAVYVGSPNSVHRDQVAAAIDAGKHVLVEKPAVASAAEWDDLVARARAVGVVLIEAMRTAYDPGLTAVRELVPSLGTLRRASFHYSKRSSRYDAVLAGEVPNIFDPAMGGGALADLGVYGLHAAILLFGEPTRVAAAASPIRTGVEGAGIALLDYSGLVVDVAYSKITTSTRPSEIQGEKATLVIDHLASPRHLTRIDNGGEVTEHVIDGPVDVLDGEVARFVELVAGGESPDADQERTAATLRTIERVRAASVAP
ncbi:Gfo/Idh/MocA family protein [Microbacterium imperiale]|uniref:Oxidoreductase YulF n=1 Tax=Microbacterium imperiale TaxID=33884 RepID=A0A9W6HJ08_9MICO|nr:Gfo/Idh/MocA family oxidoreductase [Microbacterium imperiale]MBP2421611.1 putative dehydrogenase [Microbacterium imperiale]MDS0199286.1 Gfo/Idh/MocA family oxidoreductase [Microbacterium imperiale]BFE41952.1 scyllo-inositol 2-dehydrogenase [Microbacterium imperiale]GLJ80904.1 putative oxidoreductase YulF [Microbacterium imperiale]